MEFTLTLKAPKDKVWNTLWEDSSYRAWTAAFTEGSRAETDWKKGSKVLFLDGKNSGMVGTIAENIPNEMMSIRYLGNVKEGIEDLDSEEARQWINAYENYSLRTVNGDTELKIDMGGAVIPPELADYFQTAWPK